MKLKRLRFGRGFRVAIGNRQAQAAEMVLEPGTAEGGSDNRHRGADQWLYVISGAGVARGAGDTGCSLIASAISAATKARAAADTNAHV